MEKHDNMGREPPAVKPAQLLAPRRSSRRAAAEPAPGSHDGHQGPSGSPSDSDKRQKENEDKKNI
jgi:hypothetical protein